MRVSQPFPIYIGVVVAEDERTRYRFGYYASHAIATSAVKGKSVWGTDGSVKEGLAVVLNDGCTYLIEEIDVISVDPKVEEEMKKEALKAKALSKLSPEERAALGFGEVRTFRLGEVVRGCVEMSTKEKVVVGHVVSHTGKRGGPWEAQEGAPGLLCGRESSQAPCYPPECGRCPDLPQDQSETGQKRKDSSSPGCSKTMSTKLALQAGWTPPPGWKAT